MVMSATSKIILGLAIFVVVTTVIFSRTKADFAVGLLMAITASPALRPTKLNLFCAVGTSAAFILAQLKHDALMAHLSIVLAIVCVVFAFSNRLLFRQVSRS